MTVSAAPPGPPGDGVSVPENVPVTTPLGSIWYLMVQLPPAAAVYASSEPSLGLYRINGLE